MRSIATKLNRIYLVVTLSVLCSTGLIAQLYLYHHARTVAHENLRTQAAALAGNLESAVAFGDAGFAQQTLNALQNYPEVQMAVVLLPDGKSFAQYGLGIDAVRRKLPLQESFINVEQHGVVQTIAFQGEAPVRLMLVASLGKLNRESLLLLEMGGGFGALILFATYGIFRRMSQTITRPIEALTAVMRTVERDGDYGQRTRIVSDDEIGELAKGFNAMLSALDMHNTKLNKELDERKRIQEKLDRLAHYDPVTHLPNRHYFGERLKMAMERSRRLGEPIAIMFVDLDNFKRVNDSFGHHVGDMLLRAVAERLAKALRTGDVVCRLGGDEFSIIVEHLPDSQQLAQIAEKLIANLTQPLRLENSDIVVTASIGITVCPDDSDNAETLLRFADVAMYTAKNSGKNAWRRFNPELASQSTLCLKLENQMRQSLQEGHFDVAYQPQIDAISGEVSGFEVLVRWNHPELGNIPPDQFIPVAEESGLIRPLGEWVLRTACRQIVVWNQDSHKRLTVAVNVSARQLVDADFAQLVLAILEETGCPAALLELEITESLLMQDVESTIVLLRKLREYGIGIAIDDFGTGYSSMAQLKNLPVTKLKIDKSFVDEIVTNRNDLAITAAITSLALNLQIKVIAEGVENNQQVQLLRQSGCHDFQGYHFAKPLPAQQIPGYLAQIKPIQKTLPLSPLRVAAHA